MRAKESVIKTKTVIFYILLVLLLSFSLDTSCYAKNYYVSKSGSNVASGSKKAPLKTIQKGISKLKAGDTLYIMGGTYYEQVKLSSKVKGSADKKITICNMPGEKVTISGKKAKSPTLLKMSGASYVTIKGLCFKDASGNESRGILVEPGTHHFKIANNTFSNINCKIPVREDNCANAILLYGEDKNKAIHHGVISGNKIHDCNTGWAESLSVTGNVTDITVNRNVISNVTNIGIDFSGNYGYCDDPAKDFPRNCTVTYNEVYNCISDYATSYGIYVDGGQNIKIKHNTVKGCSGGIEIGAEQKPPKEKYSTAHIVVSDNLVENNIENGITIGGYEKNLGWVIDVTVENNVCKNNGLGNAVLTLSKCKDVIIKGNTFNNTKKSTPLVYSEMNSAYTKNITFVNNKYGNSKNYCVFRGKTYPLTDWIKKMEQGGRSRSF